MQFIKWLVPALCYLSALTTASGTDEASGITGGQRGLVFSFGLAASTPTSTSTTAPSPSQPSPTFSLDLNFFLQVANHELRCPIMPLHLLGKKSWNVYNTANIEKVQRDEAIEAARIAAEEQSMQELDATRRLQILRGEEPTPSSAIEEISHGDRKREHDGDFRGGRERKKRKKAGENDTDFEMRLAHEQTASASNNKERGLVLANKVDAPIVDETGHISLFPQEAPKQSQQISKCAEAERETAKKRKEYEDQYTVKFSDAAGFKQGLENPWYSKQNNTTTEEMDAMPGKDVWGNEDPRRKEREAKRMVSNDPLATMRQGAKQVREVEKERKRWREEKEKEMKALEYEARRKRHKRKRDRDCEDDLEDFKLDSERSDKHSSRRKEDEREKRHRHSHRRYSDREDERRHRHKI
ncbi:hypothetical protein HYALB_00013969 [Hymenoscyphus albidus]|uniref:CBF1-interacting co-repressor CIR N-terminal domain-containing protein n=1 Tax=Hymenoscyphus albidus TaxID=595503 RepID=A0A9N9QCC6_9HELO|nr:hypothetical protein HYALB_00013969 [Hymenoscyphus albidus]